MILKINHRMITLAGAILMIVSLSGCKDLFKDPLADKNTGDKVTLLLLDRNFIKTKMAVRLQDITTQETIDQEEVEIRFLGDDAANLITFSGIKKTNYKTSSGFTEVGYDPNIPVNAQNPIEFTVVAISAHYISAPQFVSFTTEGVKNLNLLMVRKPLGKSGNSVAFGEPFDISYDGVLHSGQLGYLGDVSTLPTGTDYDYLNLYMTAAGGALLCDNLTDNIVFSDFGAFIVSATGPNVVPDALPIKSMALQANDFVYSSVLRSGIEKCDEGLTIHVERADGKAGTGVFGYRITYSDDTFKSGQISCTFPSTQLIEQIYYPGANSIVKVELFQDAQYSFSAAVILASACGARADFTATPKSGLTTYKFITQYSCPDSPVGMGLSILGEFRKAGTTGTWTSFEFIEGISELLLDPDAEYDFRVNIDGEYHSYTVPTNPTEVEAFLLNNQNEDYQFRSLSVVSSMGLVTITAEIEFSDGVCDALQ